MLDSTPWLWILGGSALAGFAAGSIALLVGGMGVYRLFLRTLRTLADDQDFLNQRFEREIKRRAGAEGGRPNKADELAQLVFDRAASAARGDDPVARPLSRAEILRRADRG